MSVTMSGVIIITAQSAAAQVAPLAGVAALRLVPLYTSSGSGSGSGRRRMMSAMREADAEPEDLEAKIAAVKRAQAEFKSFDQVRGCCCCCCCCWLPADPASYQLATLLFAPHKQPSLPPSFP
jgi:hypothetical protein